MVIILKISQPICKISNANIVNQKIISRLLTLEFWLHTKAVYSLVNNLPRAVAEICTCSMLTVTVQLLYRKLIPLRCLPWCDNLITLGCRRIFFFCFSKVKNRRVVRAFRVPGRQPLDQIGWNSERMLSERSPTKRCLRILITLFIKKLCLFFEGSPIFFPFLTLCSCKIITNACAKNLRHCFWGQCVKKRTPC